jgi:hypothetical protein
MVSPESQNPHRIPNERSGRPMGGERFVTRLEAQLGRILHPQKRGPKGPRRSR